MKSSIKSFLKGSYFDTYVENVYNGVKTENDTKEETFDKLTPYFKGFISSLTSARRVVIRIMILTSKQEVGYYTVAEIADSLKEPHKSIGQMLTYLSNLGIVKCKKMDDKAMYRYATYGIDNQVFREWYIYKHTKPKT